MSEAMFYLTDSVGDPVVNVFEINEGWCWAVFWQRQAPRKNRGTTPSQVPPDWIKGLKEIGYRCHKVRVVSEKSDKEVDE